MFSEKLQNLRKEKGISQEELSEILDVSRQSISKYENGTSQPSFEKLVMIAKYFEVSTDDLLGSEEIKKQEPNVMLINSTTNKILIRSKASDNVSSYYKFILSPIFGRKDYHPEIMLMGVDRHNFFGDSADNLAWYATKEDAEKELNEILSAISNNEPAYELKYYVNIKKKGFLNFEMDIDE